MMIARCGVSIAVLMGGAAFVSTVSAASGAIPVWAYGTDPAAVAPDRNAQPDENLKQLPGAVLKFTVRQIQDPFSPADWFPNDHPAMLDIVAYGRKPTIWACALCHYPNGKGKPENAGVSGLPVSYFV